MGVKERQSRTSESIMQPMKLGLWGRAGHSAAGAGAPGNCDRDGRDLGELLEALRSRKARRLHLETERATFARPGATTRGGRGMCARGVRDRDGVASGVDRGRAERTSDRRGTAEGPRHIHAGRAEVVRKAAFVPLCAGGCPQVILERRERTRPTRDEDGRDQVSVGVQQTGRNWRLPSGTQRIANVLSLRTAA